MLDLISALTRRTSLRRSPLARSTPPQRRKRLRWRSSSKAAQQRAWNAITDAKLAAFAPCELAIPGVCDGNPCEGHHWLARALGGLWVWSNHRLTCRPCHRYATHHPAEAYAAGWSVRRADAQVKVGGAA